MVEEITHLELTLAQFNELFIEIEKIKSLMEIIKWFSWILNLDIFSLKIHRNVVNKHKLWLLETIIE